MSKKAKNGGKSASSRGAKLSRESMEKVQGGLLRPFDIRKLVAGPEDKTSTGRPWLSLINYRTALFG